MSASVRKIAANQANALQSTGPRTSEGKARSCRNALRHGAASIGILAALRGEHFSDLHCIRAAMLEQYQSANIVEMQVVEIIASAYVRLQRSEEFSTALLDGTMETIQARYKRPTTVTSDEPFGCAVALSEIPAGRAWGNVERYRLRAHIDYHRAVEHLTRHQSRRRDEPVREINRQHVFDTCLKRTRVPVLPIPAPRNEPTVSLGSRIDAATVGSLFTTVTPSPAPSPNDLAPQHGPAGQQPQSAVSHLQCEPAP